MKQFEEYFSEKVLKLFNLAKSLCPEKEIEIKEMIDQTLLMRSIGGAACTENDGKEIIYLDPKRLNEHVIAHEIMHLIIHRAGWPQMFGMIGRDQFSKKLADTIDNTIDHYLLYPVIERLGIDTEKYKEDFSNSFINWPDIDQEGQQLLHNALVMWQGLLFGGDYREKVIKNVGTRQSETIKLALELEKLSKPLQPRNKLAIRRVMLNILDFISKWSSVKSGIDQELHKRIGITPLFTKDELQLPALQRLSIESCPKIIENEYCWLISLVLKDDQTRCQTYIGYQCTSEPTEIHEIRYKLENKKLGNFLHEKAIKYGLITHSKFDNLFKTI